MKKPRVWQAIVPGTQNKPQDTLQIRKTPWHGVTKQPPAVPLPGPNVTPEPNEKIKGLAGNCSRHTKQATRHPSNQENTLARRDETASCRPSARAKGSGRHPAVPLPGPNVTPEPNEKINQGSGRQLFQAHKPSHKTPFKSGKHPGAARRNSLLPSLCPGQTSLLNRMEKIKGLAGNCSRHTNQATRHPSNQENTLARRDETASCRPSAAKRHS